MIKEVGREIRENHLIEPNKGFIEEGLLVTCGREVRKSEDWKMAVGFGRLEVIIDHRESCFIC